MSYINQAKITTLKLLYLAGLMVLFFLWSFQTDDVTPYSLGQFTGLLGFSLLSLQFVLSGRWRFLERAVGLDRLMVWHRYNGYVAFSSLLLHPLLISYPSLVTTSLLDYVLGFTLYIYLGIAALALLIIQIVTSIATKRLHLTYEQWHLIHFTAYLVIALGAVHSFSLGTHLQTPNPILIWWGSLLLLAISSVIYRYLIRPKNFRWYTIDRLIKESPDVTSIRFGSKSPARLEYYPGQFAFVIFDSPKVPREEHHFTLSSSPTENYLQYTAKALGDFTQTLPRLRKGDKVRIDGPYGVFTNHGMSGSFIFLVGGIGITPIRSMIKYMVDNNIHQRTTVIYSVKTLKDAVFNQELQNFAGLHKWLKVILVLSEEKQVGILNGYVTQEIINKYAPYLPKARIFICGPLGFMAAMRRLSLTLGAPPHRIYTERFALK